jgi:hypothetical protein
MLQYSANNRESIKENFSYIDQNKGKNKFFLVTSFENPILSLERLCKVANRLFLVSTYFWRENTANKVKNFAKIEFKKKY